MNVLLYSRAMIHLCTGRTSKHLATVTPPVLKKLQSEATILNKQHQDVYYLCSGWFSREKMSCCLWATQGTSPFVLLGGVTSEAMSKPCVLTLFAVIEFQAVSEGLLLPVAVPNIIAWCSVEKTTSPQAQAWETSSCCIPTEKSRATETAEQLLRNTVKKFSPKAYHILLPHLTISIYEQRGLLIYVFFICWSPFSKSGSVT